MIEFQPWTQRASSLNHIRWFDGDAALLLVFACVCEACFSGAGGSNDPRLGHQRVRQSGLPVIHVGDHRHVPDVGLLVHDGADLIHREVNLKAEGLHSSSCFFYSWYLAIYSCPPHLCCGSKSYIKKSMFETESISLRTRSVDTG